jgi:predicted MFS family arabinose efflux permease
MTRNLRLLSLCIGLWGLGVGLFIYFVPLYMRELGADPVQIGAILGLSSLGTALMYIPGGYLADHYERRRLMIFASLVGISGVFIMYLASGLAAYALGLIVYLLSEAFIFSPMSAYITTARGNWSASRALTTANASFPLGGIFGALFGGLLAEAVGLRAGYLASEAALIVSTLVMLSVSSQPPGDPSRSIPYLDLFSHRRFRWLLALVLFAVFAMNLYWPFTPVYLEDIHGVSLSQIGLFGTVNGMGSVAINLGLGRLDAGLAFTLAQVITAGSCLLLWKGSALPWFALAYFMAAAFKTSRSLLVAIADRLVDRSEVGKAYGIVQSAGDLAVMLAASAAGALYEAKADSPFTIGVILLGSSVLLTILFTSRPDSKGDTPDRASPPH